MSAGACMTQAGGAKALQGVLLYAGLALLSAGVAADAELLAAGERVFNEVAGLGCKTCHGEYAEGDLGVGPVIRGARIGNVQAAVEAVGEMVAIRAAMGEPEIRAVSAYLEYLGGLQVVRTLSKRGRFVPAEQAVHPGTPLQIIVKNSATVPHTYIGEGMGMTPLTIPGRSAAAFVWQAPQEEGDYVIACTDCLLEEVFTIRVSEEAKPFVGAKPATRLTDAQ